MHDPNSGLPPEEQRDFRRLAGIMVPASDAYGVPGADDAAIFADILASLGRDREAVRAALADLAALSAPAGGRFADLPAERAEALAMRLLDRQGPITVALGRAVLQCYYRDDRVARALGREPRPPFPKGHALEPGDWSLLDAQRGRPRMWRDIDGRGGETAR